MGWGIGVLELAAVMWGICGCWLDFASRRLPNWWLSLGVVLLIAFAIARATGGPNSQMLDAQVHIPDLVFAVAVGSALWFGIYFGAFLFSDRAIGAGDVKLAALLGGEIGVMVAAPMDTAVLTILAMLLAAIFTLVQAASSAVRSGTGGRRQARPSGVRRALAHGPAMISSVAVVWAINAGWL